ncbi:hypothetical protein HU200_064181 [Digitaria exilis]|uniref:Pentatricopeptide repeat-containing protein n=1 Tax=Digitaria exilis TaxID=1010633 RepID=A0A835DVM9_9POAL|nr:hypothetical protein HU200_064181 [Digitaria exilis]
MSRALARRPVPPFLRLRSTVCDDGYWMGRLDHKDWLAPNEVLKVFANIRDPSLITSVFNKACGRRDYKPSEALYSLMIDKLACARRFSDVEELLARARTEKFRFSDEFFYRLVKMYGNVAEHPQKAIDTLFAMPSYNCWPSTKTFNYVLHMLVCKRQYEVVHEIYSSAPKLGVTLDTCSFNILVKGLCQFGKFDDAISLLHEMPKQGCQPNDQDIAADTVVYNILISGLCREERVTEAFNLFKSMTSEGCYPNSGTYQVLLDGLISSGKFLEAKNLVSIMSKESVRPSFQSYKLLIDGLCSDDCLDDAHLVLKQMVGQGFVPRMGTWRKLLTSIC